MTAWPDPPELLLQIIRGERADDLYATYRHLRAVAPVVRFNNIRATTRYADCLEVMRDRAFGKGSGQAFDLPGFERRQELDLEMIPSLLFLNPPDHTRLRGLVSRAFTPRRVQALTPMAEAVTDAMLDDLAERGAGGRPVDLMATFAFSLPIHVIGGLVGVPEADHDRFRTLVPAGSRWIEPGATDDEVVAGKAAALEMITYFGDLLRERRACPADDLFSALIEVRDDDGARLSRRELIINTIQLFSAGFHTTQNMIGNGVRTLLEHPAELARLRADPGLLPTAVEELLRFETTTQAIGRVALEPTTVAGEPVAAGDWVLAFIGAANRDPAVFPDPDRLDLARRPNDHLSFSSGIRYCLGASLARMELGVAFDRLFRRFPDLALAEDAPPWRDGMLVRGPARLLVTL